MIIHSTVQGEAARKYGEFTYLKPIPLPIDIRHIDPERVNPAQEFPRYVDIPREPATKVVELADCEIEVSGTDVPNNYLVQVRMIPNDYTPAKASRVVGEMNVSIATDLSRELEDLILGRFFKTGEQT